MTEQTRRVVWFRFDGKMPARRLELARGWTRNSNYYYFWADVPLYLQIAIISRTAVRRPLTRQGRTTLGQKKIGQATCPRRRHVVIAGGDLKS